MQAPARRSTRKDRGENIRVTGALLRKAATLIPEGQVNNRCNPLVNALLSGGVLCIKLVYTSKDIFSICILCENIAIPVIIMFEFNPIDCVIFFANMIPLILCVVYPSMLSS